ncbi:uncharacterized protein F5Z01DRAFT_626019 [Emericellopsis atlantica]|uniref:Oxysterol-binding protein n=1 Tax=Emericellopsis atlantica TaxID=2614577 RepID=A0A9P7ZHI1_9HYPO|nr:uncharacterized protein F5Z01DRAFT_626019 [Emericellopsis atlantica]KAG9252218.1 hypothetical protein F5Z01DRAFT_626019 [Emericellopsis atlantica]
MPRNLSNLRDNLSQLKDFLSYLSTVEGDLSNITAPPFILAPKSAIEVPSAWASRHDLFLAPAGEPDPQLRAVLVAKNYLCSLKQLVDEGGENAAKKPLNPFLGELFIGTYGEGANATRLISEQVSHHPPVTACYMHNEEHGITSRGFAAQQTSFSASNGVAVKQIGYAVVRVDKYDEEHLMTMPTLLIKGLTTGSPHPELGGPCYISSSSGPLTKIEFGSGGTFGLGKKNKVQATVYKTPSMKDVLCEFSGHWDGKMAIKDPKGEVLEEFQADDMPPIKPTVRPVEQQTTWESRRAWSKVFEGIYEGNVQKIHKHKSALEEAQRALRQKEKASGSSWEPCFFTNRSEDARVTSLLKALPEEARNELAPTKTAGSWNSIGIGAAEDILSRLHALRANSPTSTK